MTPTLIGDDIIDRRICHCWRRVCACTWHRSPHVKELNGNGGEGPNDNGQIHPQSDVFGVKNIHIDHLPESRPVFSVHLPETGEAGQCINSLTILGRIELKFANGAGTRSHHAHFAAHDIEELWQLIEADGAKKLTTWDESRITLGVKLDHRRIGNH